MNKAKEWLSIEDPTEDRTWPFDITFLKSNWSCIFGSGCPSISIEPALDIGCCAHGAYFSDNDDRARTLKNIDQLDKDLWQNLDFAESIGGPITQDDDGSFRTVVVDGACIFQNRAGHPGGSGCAFHHLATKTGQSQVKIKPDICWQVPLRREDHETTSGHVFSMVREWQKADWGGDSTDVAWWCTEEEKGYTGKTSVYESMSEELTAICGSEVYEWLKEKLIVESSQEVFLPNPIVKKT